MALTSDANEAALLKHPICVTIAGFDPSSGAGVTADLKTFAAHGIYGVAAITALTVQSTQGVRTLEPMTPGLLRQTIDVLTQDMELAGVKIGMLCRAGLAAEVDSFLRRSPALRDRAVLDPVLRSSSGTELLDRAGLAVLRERLLGSVGWVTPNLDELALLTGMEVKAREQVPEAAAALAALGVMCGNSDLNVVVTGGHLDSPDDYVLAAGVGTWAPGLRVETTSTHGTGCAFSTALLAALVFGYSGATAVSRAKSYVDRALRAAYPVGHGRGPLHHLFALDELVAETGTETPWYPSHR
jgi:hydroxymethylpyrimidine/phosphomethylpyrimidine kinase